MYKISSWNMIFTLYPNEFWHKKKIILTHTIYFIATNIPQRLKTGFVVQGHNFDACHLFQTASCSDIWLSLIFGTPKFIHNI